MNELNMTELDEVNGGNWAIILVALDAVIDFGKGFMKGFEDGSKQE